MLLKKRHSGSLHEQRKDHVSIDWDNPLPTPGTYRHSHTAFFSKNIKGTVAVSPEFAEGLTDLQEFSHIHLFYYFHQSQKTCLHVKPFLENREHGIFATRSSHRPNKLRMSLVRLTKIEGNVLYVKDIDILDGTPLIDIKPYIQRFDSRKNVRSGGQDGVSDDTAAIRGISYLNARQESGGIESHEEKQ